MFWILYVTKSLHYWYVLPVYDISTAQKISKPTFNRLTKTSFDEKTKSLELVKTENLIPQKSYVM